MNKADRDHDRVTRRPLPPRCCGADNVCVSAKWPAVHVNGHRDKNGVREINKSTAKESGEASQVTSRAFLCSPE